MKISTLLLFTLIGVYSSPDEGYQRFVHFPDDNGIIHLIDLENRDLPPHRFDPETDVKFYLYTRQNGMNPVEFFIGNVESLFGANFDLEKPVKINIHGWTGHAENENNIVIVQSFLDNMDVNIIVVDWAVGASADYISAVRYVPMVGAKIGEMIDWLNVLGVPFTNFHVIGHSMGGHIAGISGRTATRGKVDYISSLDPAFPLFVPDSEQRIRKTDGKYVEVMHTNGGQSGLKEPLGHTDFYPNGGIFMPGCSLIDLPCHHNRAYHYMADSIDHQRFMADQCYDYDEIKNGTCSNIGKLHMGGETPKFGFEGVYYLETNAEKPFYKD